MFQNVELLGNLGDEPEFRQTRNGKEVAAISLATEESVPDRDNGGFKSKTTWHRVSVFNPRALALLRKAGKGSRLYLTCAIDHDRFTDSDGTERVVPNLQLRPYEHTMKPVDLKNGGSGNRRASGDEYGTRTAGEEAVTPEDTGTDVTDLPEHLRGMDVSELQDHAQLELALDLTHIDDVDVLRFKIAAAERGEIVDG